MNIIICLDDKNGIQFNHRRQSRDQVVCHRMLELAQGSNLWMNGYSAKLFPGDQVRVDENFLQSAGAGDYCFAEDADFLAYAEKIDKVIVYRWNKVYPSDVKIEKAFLAGRKLVQTEDFPGSSHEKITQEIYV